MPLFLIGFMGAGKTTLGRALEARLPGWRYTDLDEVIERQAGISISEIFSTFGEDRFRELERQALIDTSTCDDKVIVGCGGGTPCYYDNMELMNTLGQTVLLQADTSILLRRLIEAQDRRPKLNGLTSKEIEEFIAVTLRQREPWYSKALHTFPSDRLETAGEIEETCRLFIDRFINKRSDKELTYLTTEKR